MIVGVFQVVHAFSAVGWKGFVLDLLLGALYIAAGYILLANPLAATIKLTLLLGIIWIVSGLFRIVLAGVLWRQAGGLFSFRASSAHWRAASSSQNGHSGLWVLGLCLGIDLIFHGFAWIGYSMSIPSNERLRLHSLFEFAGADVFIRRQPAHKATPNTAANARRQTPAAGHCAVVLSIRSNILAKPSVMRRMGLAQRKKPPTQGRRSSGCSQRAMNSRARFLPGSSRQPLKAPSV